MSEFKSDPVLILTTAEETRAAVLEPAGWFHVGTSLDKYLVKSLWLIALIDEYVATGKYPYNSSIQRLAEQRLGLPQMGEAGTPLSLLVYNAQTYRRSDELIAAGFVPATDELLAEAHRRGLKIEMQSGELLTVREVNGKLYAMKPRKRKWAAGIGGYPVRLADSRKAIPAKLRKRTALEQTRLDRIERSYATEKGATEAERAEAQRIVETTK